MPKIKDKKKKKQVGGARTLQFLLAADTFHDFWNCDRGIWNRATMYPVFAWRALLNYKLIDMILLRLPIVPAPPHPLGNFAYRIRQELGWGGVPRYVQENLNPDLQIIANGIFGQHSAGSVSLPNIEGTVEDYMDVGLPGPGVIPGCAPLGVAGEVYPKICTIPAPNFELPPPGPRYSYIYTDNNLFEIICKDILGLAPAVEMPNVHLICDVGASIFGHLGYLHPRMNLVITPQTIGDSAGTSLQPRWILQPNIIIDSVFNTVELQQQPLPPLQFFLSDSNRYTTRDNGFVLFYKGLINHDNIYNFRYCVNGMEADFGVLNIENNAGDNIEVNISNGPSAGQLASMFLYRTLGPGNQQIVEEPADTPANISIRQQNIYEKFRFGLGYAENPNNQIRERGEQNVPYFFGGIDNPLVYLDIKRGGDRDQVMAAARYQVVNPDFNVIFVTNDRLCAVQAVMEGLPTVWYSNGPRTIRYWRRGAYGHPGWAGGASINLNINKRNNNKMDVSTDINSDNEDESLREETVSIEDFIYDITSRAAAMTNSFISKNLVELNQISLLFRIESTIKFMFKHNFFDKSDFTKIYILINQYNAISQEKISNPKNKNELELLIININSLITKINISITSEKRNLIIKELLEFTFSELSENLLNFIKIKYYRTKPGFLLNNESINIYNKIIKLLNMKKSSAIIVLSLLNAIILQNSDVKATPTFSLFYNNDINAFKEYSIKSIKDYNQILNKLSSKMNINLNNNSNSNRLNTQRRYKSNRITKRKSKSIL